MQKTQDRRPSSTGPETGVPTPNRAGVRIGERLRRFASAVWRPLILLALLGVVWWFITAREMVERYLVPTPGSVVEVLWDERSMFWEHSYVTFYETVIGFIIAAAVGVLAAVLIVYSETAERTLYPIILFAQVIPKIAIAPILVVWFGTGLSPKIILAVLIAFFPVVISGVAGLRATDPELLDLSATMGASRLNVFVKVRFPGALPQLMSGLKVAVTLAVVGAVVGEFVGASEGLGYVLLQASGNLNSALLFADLILMSAIGIVLFVAIEAIEALLIPWHASRRNAGGGSGSTMLATTSA